MAPATESHTPSSIRDPRHLLLLAGPTAVGKSELALLLAEKLGGEIVSVDSMQVYRGMNIGTAKPSRVEQARVRHHLLDVVEVTEPFDAARFVTLAQAAVAEIQSRDRLPILCGGTGLYFNALLKGLGQGPPADAALRAQLETMALDEMLRELAEHDPMTYERIDRHNRRRLIRALEVIRLTGKPFSAQRANWGDSAPPSIPSLGFGFFRPADQLRQRIDARVEKMFADGLVEETKELLAQGLANNQGASQALGYRQAIAYLRGETSLPDAISLLKTRTRQFAKRQMTWFRRQLELTWIDLGEVAATDCLERIVQALRSAG